MSDISKPQVLPARQPTQDETIARFLGDAVSTVATQLGERAEAIEKYRAEAAKYDSEAAVVREKRKQIVRSAEISATSKLTELKISEKGKRFVIKIGAVAFALLLLCTLVGVALWKDKDALAVEIIKTSLTAGVSALGGYGIGVRKANKRDDD